MIEAPGYDRSLNIAMGLSATAVHWLHRLQLTTLSPGVPAPATTHKGQAEIRPPSVGEELTEKMANFTVRAELHQATWADYETLHAAMEARGFSRQIISGEGKTYQLPLAEYNGSGNLDSARVRDIAREAANITGKTNAVLVSESTSRAWIGLQSIR